jgi:hypothetical protein
MADGNVPLSRADARQRGAIADQCRRVSTSCLEPVAGLGQGCGSCSRGWSGEHHTRYRLERYTGVKGSRLATVASIGPGRVVPTTASSTPRQAIIQGAERLHFLPFPFFTGGARLTCVCCYQDADEYGVCPVKRQRGFGM